MKAGMTMTKLALAVGLSATMATAANAALITEWDYTQEFEWVEPISPGSVVKEGTTDTLDDVDGFTKLSWGSPANTFNQVSSLVINPEAGDSTTASGDLTQGTVTTATDINAMTFALGPVVVHNNFVITGTSLNSATAEDNVILTPAAPAVGADQTQNVLFTVDFEETQNSLTGAACPSGTENSFGCGDIFALSGGLIGTPTVVNNTEVAFLIDSFVRDGYLYEVFLQEATGNLGVLPDPACSAVGEASGCIGFVTDENEVNRFQLQFAVLATEQQVPEPATLGLLAGGLLAAGWGRRRKSGQKRA